MDIVVHMAAMVEAMVAMEEEDMVATVAMDTEDKVYLFIFPLIISQSFI